MRLLEQRRDRMSAFLGSVESLCGERAPSGSYAFERECVRVALGGFQTAEHAEGAELQYRTRRLAAGGSWDQPPNIAGTGQLATIFMEEGVGRYAMAAVRKDLSVRIRVPLADVDAIFQDRSGLGANGEIFFTDSNGSLLTISLNPRSVQVAKSAPFRSCLAGTTSQVRVVNEQGTDMISAFRPVPAAGGGCIVANLPYADVLVPIHQLGRRFIMGSVGFVVLGALIAVVIARTATQPIARLAEAARELEDGYFDRPVPIAGPSEVQQLGRALSSMARSVGDLVQREQEARIEAESANRTKDEFLAMLSHELRTPLTSILGWSTILMNRRTDEQLDLQGLQAIERAATKQVRLVEELLDVSRIVAGKLRLNNPSHVSLTHVVEVAIEEMLPSADAKAIGIVKTIDPTPVIINGDGVRLQQMIGNLLSNAVRFTPNGGTIDVTLTRHDETAEIRVADTGIGISADFLPQVFERFRQADSSTTRSYGGLGLGLAIAKHFVELHGGTIRAESDGDGRGATFVVTLPCLVAGTARAAEPGRGQPVPPLLEGTRVLVVDDDPDTLSVVRTILEGAGALVQTAPSAVTARAILWRAHPDLLIADIGMPREDGYSLLRSLRALRSNDASLVPAIALTAHVRPEDEEHALASGFQMHVAKPVDAARLLTAVTTMLIRSWSNETMRYSINVNA